MPNNYVKQHTTGGEYIEQTIHESVTTTKEGANLLKIVFALDEILQILRLRYEHEEKATRAVFLHFDV